GHTVLPSDASAGGGADGPWLALARSAALPRAAVAAASGGMSPQGRGTRSGQLVCAGATRPPSRRRGRHQGCAGHWEALRGRALRPFCSCDSRPADLLYLPAGWRYRYGPARAVKGLASGTTRFRTDAVIYPASG